MLLAKTLLLILHITVAKDLSTLYNEVGSTFCKWLAGRNLIGRGMWDKCGEPSCSWDNWTHAMNVPTSRKHRIVISYGHNGFGNQLWQVQTLVLVIIVRSTSSSNTELIKILTITQYSTLLRLWLQKPCMLACIFQSFQTTFCSTMRSHPIAGKE